MALFIVLTVDGASAEVPRCADFPKSEFWSNATHDSIISYVRRRHDGNWDDYLAKWRKQLDSMRNIHKRGGSAVFKSKEMTISGEQLADYIKVLQTRVEVTECLASWQK